MNHLSGLLSSSVFTRDELLKFLKKAHREFKAPSQLTVLRESLGILAFFEPSTRTRVSFEAASLGLGLRWIHLRPEDSSLQKGETIKDTLLTLDNYNPDLFVVRHKSSGFPEVAAEWVKAPLINAGDGMRDHPTQGLLDALVLYQLSQSPLKITFFGDVYRSRVFRADQHFLRLLGHRLSICDDESSETALTAEAYKLPLVSRKALSKADVIICLRVQTERGSTVARRPLDKSDFGPKTLIMHPGPAIQGQDLSEELALFLETSSQSLILKQVQAGLCVRRLLLVDCLKQRGTLK